MTLGPVRVMGAGVVGKHYVEEVNIHSCAVLYVTGYWKTDQNITSTWPIAFYRPS